MVLVQVDDETHELIKEAKKALRHSNKLATQSDAINQWLSFGKSEDWKIPRVVF